jgi:hypothetical protein
VAAKIHEEDDKRNNLDGDHFWSALDLVQHEVKGLNKDKNDPKSSTNRKLDDPNVLNSVQVIYQSGVLNEEEDKDKDNSKDQDKTDEANDIELMDDVEDVSVFDDEKMEEESIDDQRDVDEMQGMSDEEEEETAARVAPLLKPKRSQKKGKATAKEEAKAIDPKEMNPLGAQDYVKIGKDNLI